MVRDGLRPPHHEGGHCCLIPRGRQRRRLEGCSSVKTRQTLENIIVTAVFVFPEIVARGFGIDPIHIARALILPSVEMQLADGKFAGENAREPSAARGLHLIAKGRSPNRGDDLFGAVPGPRIDVAIDFATFGGLLSGMLAGLLAHIRGDSPRRESGYGRSS